MKENRRPFRMKPRLRADDIATLIEPLFNLRTIRLRIRIRQDMRGIRQGRGAGTRHDLRQYGIGTLKLWLALPEHIGLRRCAARSFKGQARMRHDLPQANFTRRRRQLRKEKALFQSLNGRMRLGDLILARHLSSRSHRPRFAPNRPYCIRASASSAYTAPAAAAS